MKNRVLSIIFLVLSGIVRMNAQVEPTPFPTPNDVPVPQTPPAASMTPCPECQGGMPGTVAKIGLAAKPPENVEETLAKLEQDWGDAIARHDVDFLERVEAADYTYTGPDGIVSHKADEIAGAKAAFAKIESFKHRDLKVQVHGDTAIVTGATTLKGKAGDVDLSGDFRWTDVFVRQGDHWQVVASQATAISKNAASNDS